MRRITTTEEQTRKRARKGRVAELRAHCRLARQASTISCKRLTRALRLKTVINPLRKMLLRETGIA